MNQFSYVSCLIKYFSICLRFLCVLYIRFKSNNNWCKKIDKFLSIKFFISFSTADFYFIFFGFVEVELGCEIKKAAISKNKLQICYLYPNP